MKWIMFDYFGFMEDVWVWPNGGRLLAISTCDATSCDNYWNCTGFTEVV